MELIVNEALKDLGIVFLVIIAVMVGLLICIRIWIIFRPIKTNDQLERKYRKNWDYEAFSGFYSNESED